MTEMQKSPAFSEAAQRVLQAIAVKQASGPHATKLDPQTTALVLVEMQGEWLAPTGRLRNLAGDGGVSIDAAAAKAHAALKAARRANLPVVHVGLSFQEGHPELGQAYYGLRGIQPITNVFVADTPGSEFDPRFKPAEGELVASGRIGGSGFAGSNLDSLLKNNGIQTIVLAGFATDVCIESTLRQGHDLGFNVLMLNDATASFSPALHDHVLEHSVRHWGVAISTDDLVRLLPAD